MTIFDTDGTLRVGVLFSGGASGFRYLQEYDPGFGSTYQIVCSVTSNPDAAGIEPFRQEDIPVEVRDIRGFYESHDTDLQELSLRETFDEETRELLEEYAPDVLLLSGYMWILTSAVIDSYPTINVHPADLTISDEEGNRKYVGFDPVTDAITAGEEQTRSTVHFVTSDVDDGPILVRSDHCTVHRELVDTLKEFHADESLEKYIAAHQEWMKWASDGPAIAKALELLSTRRIEIDGETITIDGDHGYFDLAANGVVAP